MTKDELIDQLCRDLNQAHTEMMVLQGVSSERAPEWDWPEWSPQANSIHIAEKMLEKRLAKTDRWTLYPEEQS